MPTIHADLDLARATAQQLRRQCVLAQYEVQSLRGRLQHLEYAWQGGASEQFRGEAHDLTRRLEAQVQQLDALITRMERELDEWQSVDQRGAATFRASAPGFWGGVLPLAAGGWLPAITLPVSVGGWSLDVPGWLKNLLAKFFPAEIPQPAILYLPPATESAPKTGLGDLLQKTPPAPEPLPVQQPEPLPVQQPAPLVEAPPAQVAPKYEIFHEVPNRSQGDLYGSAACVPTSVSMVLDYFHARDGANATATPAELIKMLDSGDGTSGSGVLLGRMNDDLGELGYKNITPNVNASMEELKGALDHGPVIVTTGVKLIGGDARDIQQAGDTIHAMVVKGLNADSVVVNDPWSGAEKTFSRDTFSDMWERGQNGMYVIRP